jgi:hypothetical protein
MLMSTKVQPEIERTVEGLLVVRLFNVPVNHDLAWWDAVHAAGPDTNTDPLFDISIWNAENKYPDTKSGIEIVPCISLVGFYGYVGGSWKAELGEGLLDKFGLPHMGPCHAFAIGIEYPQLNRDLNRGYFSVISFQPRYIESFYENAVPLVGWGLDERHAGMHSMRTVFYNSEYVGLIGEATIVS